MTCMCGALCDLLAAPLKRRPAGGLRAKQAKRMCTPLLTHWVSHPHAPPQLLPPPHAVQAGFDTTNRVKDVEQRWLDNLPPEAAVPVQADERPADPLHYSGTALKALQTSTTNSYKTATGEDRARGAYEPYQLPQSSCEYGWLSGPQVPYPFPRDALEGKGPH